MNKIDETVLSPTQDDEKSVNTAENFINPCATTQVASMMKKASPQQKIPSTQYTTGTVTVGCWRPRS